MALALVNSSPGSLSRMSNGDLKPSLERSFALADRNKSRISTWVEQGYYLQVIVKSASHLAALGVLSASPDPYVKVTLGSAEFTTRTVFRNRSPVFEESCVLPLRGLRPEDESVQLVASIHHSDAVKDRLVGQAQLPIKKLLSSIPHENVNVTDSHPLTKNNGPVAGEVVLQCSVITAHEAQEKPIERPYAESVLRRDYGGRSLEVHVKAVHGLRTSVGAEEVQRTLKDLQLEVRVGTVLVRVPVTPKRMVIDQPNTPGATMSVLLDDKLVIPLESAFVPSSSGRLNRKLAGELADVRIFFNAGNNPLAKAQLPVWCVSEAPDMVSIVEDDDTAPADIPCTASEPEVQQLFMERYTRALTHPVRLEASLQLVKTQLVSVDGATLQSLTTEDDEDVSGAPPLPDHQVPAPLPTQLIQEELPCGPCRLYQLLVSTRDSVMQRVFDKERLREAIIPEFSNSEGGNPATRTVTYWRPLNIPMGPKEAKIEELHTLHVKAPGGWVLTLRVTTNAPKGDCFAIMTQVVARRGASPGTCCLRVSMNVDWVKPPGLLKGVISSNATKDTTSHWQEMVAAARSQIAAGGLARASENGNMAATAAAATGVAGKASTAQDVRMETPRGVMGLPDSMSAYVLPALCALAMLVVVLLLLLWRQAAAGRHRLIVAGARVSALESDVVALSSQLDAAQARITQLLQQVEEQKGFYMQTAKAAADTAAAALRMCTRVDSATEAGASHSL